jgi:hypothetical protein
MSTTWLRDPTAEIAAVVRKRRAPPASLAGRTIALFDIGKARSDEFLDRVAQRLHERGLKTQRYAKPTNAKVAPVEVIQRVATEADLVLIGLSD